MVENGTSSASPNQSWFYSREETQERAVGMEILETEHVSSKEW
jgi:hypothetical protein